MTILPTYIQGAYGNVSSDSSDVDFSDSEGPKKRKNTNDKAKIMLIKIDECFPPGDEGWLCPACDCKVDCVDLLNDSMGTDLSINDTWEKVFPETAVFGDNLNDISGLPFDDSEDNDYNPNAPQVAEGEVDVEDPNSNESDDSASITCVPTAITHSLVPLHNNGKNEVTSSEVVKESVVSEKYEEILKTNMENDDSTPITARRHVQRLDYKKLHDVELFHKIFKLCGSPPEEYWKKSKLPHAAMFKPQHPYESCLLETFKELPKCVVDLIQTLLSVEPYKRETA
ncbi:unnamed protein product [Lactuca saligna]|uniref:Uncharacterized protein n=1 Tax=Lactuca saligna TaxID=75948 RepID=A0AA35Y7B4_LACSI|nr:unnamed protein product [Lactuca saligna]